MSVVHKKEFGWCNKLTVLIKTMHGVNNFKVTKQIQHVYCEVRCVSCRQNAWFKGLKKELQSVAFVRFLLARSIREIHKMPVIVIELLLSLLLSLMVYGSLCTITMSVNKQ